MTGGNVKKMIKIERLIELAEGKTLPTADEQGYFSQDEALRKELADLRSLFSDLRNLQEPQIEENALQGLLPALRTQIDKRRARTPLPWFVLTQSVNRSFAAAAAMVILIGLAISFGIQAPADLEQPRTYVGLNQESSFEIDESGSGDLLIEACSIPDLDLFPELAQELNEDFTDFFGNEVSTTSLMELAALDDSTLALLESYVRPNKEQFRSILKILQASDL